MAEFNAFTLTKAGISLITKALAGACSIKFTKVQSGDGTWSTDLSEATALKSQKQEFGFSKIKTVNDSTVSILAVLNNSDLSEGYYVREIGIYGAEEGNESTTEVLYGIVTADEGKADFMPPYNSISPQTMEIETLVAVANAAEVTIQAGSGALASADMVNQLSADVDSLKTSLSDSNEKITSLEKITGSSTSNILALDIAVSILNGAQIAGTTQNIAVETFADDSSFRIAEGIYDKENKRIYA